MKKFLLIYFLMLVTAFPQGSRPPVTTLNGLDDVQISSPSIGEILTYDTTSVPPVWRNVIPASVNFGDLNGVVITTPLNNQVLKYNAASFSWVNYGPLAFSDLTGNINVSQMNSGAGATASSFWRGDGTWAPVANAGTIPITTGVLMGDGFGNATVASTLFADNSLASVTVSKAVSAGDTELKVVNAAVSGGATSSVMLSGLSVDPGATFRYYEGGYPTTGMIQNTDASLNSAQGRLLISGKNNILFSNDGPLLATERMRLGNGLMIGTTIDKGSGTANVTGGYYVNGNKIGGVATLSSSVDQTVTAETVHLSYTVPANTVQVGTTFRIYAWGNMDNPASAITYTPRIRWGGTGGALLMATPAITSSTTAGTNRDWEIDARVTVRSLGAIAGTCVAMLHEGNHMINALPTYFADVATSGATAIGIDTTINRDICLTWTLSTPTGTPHVRTIGGVIEIVEP